MSRSVFISRSLEEERILFYSNTYGIQLKAESLVDFSAAKKQHAPDADILFFYSKKGVEYFHELYGKESFSRYQLASLGNAGHQAIKTLGYQTSFAGNGEIPVSKKAFNAFARGKRVLFARAKNSKASFENDNIQYEAIPLVVYNNEPKDKVVLPHVAINLFTSPLNVIAYLNNGGNKDTPAVAIGPTTFDTLKENFFKSVHQSETSSEKSIILKAIHLLEKKI